MTSAFDSEDEIPENNTHKQCQRYVPVQPFFPHSQFSRVWKLEFIQRDNPSATVSYTININLLTKSFIYRFTFDVSQQSLNLPFNTFYSLASSHLNHEFMNSSSVFFLQFYFCCRCFTLQYHHRNACVFCKYVFVPLPFALVTFTSCIALAIVFHGKKESQL